ncbi:LysR family transcriptional regulator [Streptomyces smyrnaeus]|uniref:helix-turn-helix domain-containing protein n=1 Tax=Streptomyces smyrnaeus TaxID=1387713 RepID=UPI0036B5270A
MARPPLSRAIAHLERRMGVRLLERTSRSVNLTGAGQVSWPRAARRWTRSRRRSGARNGRDGPTRSSRWRGSPTGMQGLLGSILRHYRHNHADPGPAGRAPRTHRLADRAALTLADLTGEQSPRWPGEMWTPPMAVRPKCVTSRR